MDEKQSKKKAVFSNPKHPSLVQFFYLISIILSSLLVPLSFLLLARLTIANYLVSLTLITPPKSLIIFPFLHTYQIILYALVLLISFTTLIHALTNRIRIYRPPVAVGYVVLCTLLVCVGLAIEATFQVGVIDARVAIDNEGILIRKLVFFLGLYETMFNWCRMIVRPMMDDSIYGGVRSVERLVERWALTAAFTAFSLVFLRVEVEALVALVVVKKEMSMKLVWSDFLGLGLYYLTIGIGWTRIVNEIKLIFVSVYCKWVTDENESIVESIRKSDDEV